MQKATVTVEINCTKHSKTINGIHEGNSTVSPSHQQNARKTGSVLIDNTQKNLPRNCSFPQLSLPTKGEIPPSSWLASSWQLMQPPLLHTIPCVAGSLVSCQSKRPSAWANNDKCHNDSQTSSQHYWK